MLRITNLGVLIFAPTGCVGSKDDRSTIMPLVDTLQTHHFDLPSTGVHKTGASGLIIAGGIVVLLETSPCTLAIVKIAEIQRTETYMLMLLKTLTQQF